MITRRSSLHETRKQTSNRSIETSPNVAQFEFWKNVNRVKWAQTCSYDSSEGLVLKPPQVCNETLLEIAPSETAVSGFGKRPWNCECTQVTNDGWTIQIILEFKSSQKSFNLISGYFSILQLHDSPFASSSGLEDFWPSDCPWDSDRKHYLYWAIVIWLPKGPSSYWVDGLWSLWTGCIHRMRFAVLRATLGLWPWRLLIN